MATADESKPKKSTLPGLLQAEQFPNPPTFNPKWGLSQYNSEWQKYVRKLEDYIRRLTARFTAANIIQELIQNPTTTQILTTIINNGGGGGEITSRDLLITSVTSEAGQSIGVIKAGFHVLTYKSGYFQYGGSSANSAGVDLINDADNSIIVSPGSGVTSTTPAGLISQMNDFFGDGSNIKQTVAFELSESIHVRYRVQDGPGLYGDNTNGSPNPTWTLKSLTY